MNVRLIFIFLLTQFLCVSAGMSSEFVRISADTLAKHDLFWLGDRWKYHPGDNSNWAKANFDDCDWEYANPNLDGENLPASGWNAVGWFRIHLAVDSTLWHQPLVLVCYQAGASRIYLNGRRIYQFSAYESSSLQNDSDRYRGYTTFTFDERHHHVIAIRYENKHTEKFHRADRDAGFYVWIGEANRTISRAIDNIIQDKTLQIGFTTLALAFGILHLVLFLFYPNLKSNLYFSITVFLYAISIFYDYQNFLASNFADNLHYLRIHRAAMPFPNIFALLFVYSIFSEKIPRHYWIIATGLIVTGALAVYKPVAYFDYIQIFIVATAIEMVRVLSKAIRLHKSGAWIIAIGFIGLLIFSSYDMMLDLNIMSPFYDINNGYPFGIVVLIISMSIYLAHDFARANEKIIQQERSAKEQEMRRKLLEADNARKSKELEDARNLQLSMLPQNVSSLPGLDICLYMQTATEVGGDYYDYLISEDGTITLAIGDATGHGMKAGTMVAVVKSMFVALAGTMNTGALLQKCSETIREMQLGNLFMGMILAQFKDGQLTIASRGMPPVYIFRKKTQSVEELIIKALPLGAPSSISSDEKILHLEPGDTVLMLSDGYIELFNDKDEMLDYHRVMQYFKEAGEKSPDAIVQHLIEKGDQWRNGRAQEDDVTFVAFKVKGE